MAIDLAKLEEAPHLLDLLIQMEDVLDSLDTYVFPNWINGSVIAGPIVRRYWLGMTLEYPADKRPDDRAAVRLIKHGIQVKVEKSHEGERKHAVDGSHDTEKTEEIWLVDISIPRRLISVLNAGQLDFYDDEVDTDDVQDGDDAGLTDETGYVDDDATHNDDPADAADTPPADPADDLADPAKGANA